jgi:tetratricopeptide (TPR) repeat protein
VWIILALGLLGLGAVGVVLARPLSPDRVLLLSSSLDNRGRDLGPGMAALLEDYLEVVAGATVTHASALPAAAELKRLPPATRLLRFQGRRDGDRLDLAVEWNTASRLLSGKAWTLQVASAQAPAQAMVAFVHGWPLKVRHRILRDLVPQSPLHFWALLEAMAILDDREATAHLEALQQLAEEEPQCATVWTTLGDHLYRSLWIKPEAAGVGLSSRTHRAFQRAVNLVPGHPRATFLWSLMLTDTGNQDAALRALEAAARLRPSTPELYFGFAYAGRTAGLLEGARRALVRRKALLGAQDEPSTWFAETTYLYLGDLEAFRQELQRAGSLRQDASILFYQGYFALLQGHPQEALGFMRAGSPPGMAPAPFRDLCRVYLAYLEGRPRDGLAELHAIDEVRGKLRIPDGEWTFKEAEAYALLGDADRAVDCATRAFVQGFSCAAWYETSPFLAKVRAHARWPMLRRNVRERQAVMEGSFPTAAFDP